jgi:sigma-B regulation protein RsbU (phosphoserine phosphatase)
LNQIPSCDRVNKGEKLYKVMEESITSAKILIVDDMDYNLLLVEEILIASGFTNIVKASNGQQALDIICKHKPELILLDLVLPDISGLDICKGIKINDKTKDTIVIVQSAQSRGDCKHKAFEMGANDFISKPIDEAELIARVKAHLEQVKLYGKIKENNHRMASELREASQMLLNLLPTQGFLDKIANDHNICISAYYQPSSELGGDFYDVLNLGESKLGLCVWDFAGHGVRAAINTFRLHGIIKENEEYNNNPGEFLSNVNGILYKMLSRSQFATMFYGVIDVEKQKLNYACASCPAPLLISFKRGESKQLDGKEFPLGIQTKSKYQTQEISIKDWDALIIYSDALIETENDSSDFLTLEELTEYLMNEKNRFENFDANQIKESIMRKFNKECIDNLRDDLTLKVITFNHRSAA